jgi:hypothetical protein
MAMLTLISRKINPAQGATRSSTRLAAIAEATCALGKVMACMLPRRKMNRLTAPSFDGGIRNFS